LKTDILKVYSKGLYFKGIFGTNSLILIVVYFLVNIFPLMSADLDLYVSGFKVPDKEILVSGKGIRISLDYLSKKLGFKKIFNSDNNILALFHEGEVAQMQLENPEAWFANESIMFSCPPVMINNNIFVEAAPVLDFLGCFYEVKAYSPVAEIISDRMQSENIQEDYINQQAVSGITVNSEMEKSNSADCKNEHKASEEIGNFENKRKIYPIAEPNIEKNFNRDSIENIAGLSGLNPAWLAEEKDGIRYYHINRYTPAGPISIHIVAVNMSDKKYRFKSVLGKDTVLGRERTSVISRRWNGMAAINGAFYANDGDPLGVIIDDKKLLSVPIFSRSVIGFTSDNKVIFGNPDFQGTIRLADNRKVPIRGLNQPSSDNEITIFTSEFGNSTHRYSKGLELVAARGRIIGIGKHNSIIPPDGYVISAGGSKADLFEGVNLWDSVKIDLSLSPGWEKVSAAVGGGPRLLKNGKIEMNGSEEKFSRAISNRRHPRSGIGITENNWILMTAVDGRQKGHSVGVTLKEFAGILKEFGCVDAINLDGGGSTTLVFDNRVVNRISDGSERAVSSALVFCPADEPVSMVAKK
jgi:exopolysaccharide biosynthesis protein